MHQHTHGIGFRYDERERRARQNPEELLRTAGLREGMTFMDIGCNDGFFAIPAAKIVGPTGKVYGVDVDESAIGYLRERAAQEGLTNIEAHTGRGEDAQFCQGCADMIFYGIVLHDFQDPAKVLERAREMLTPEGKVVNLDWQKIPTEKGPPLAVRLSPEDVRELFEQAGLSVQQTSDKSADMYIVTAGLA